MSTLPGRARAVVIGAGIVGNSVAYHLHQQGWSDLVLIDKGPFPNPGGSTGHASNFIFPVDHSKEMTALTADSVRQYKELGVFTAERRHRGRAHRGADAGAAPAHGLGALVGHRRRVARDAGRRSRRWCRSSTRASWSAGSTPRASASSTRCGRARSCASARRRPARSPSRPTPRCSASTSSTAVVRRVRTHARRHRGRDRRSSPAASGARKLARMAGASIPLTPAVHQMIDVGPVPRFADRQVAHRVPDRARHGHEHVRAPGRRRPRDRLLRPPPDPARPRGDPLGRGGGALADRVPVHAGRLRAADGARARADAPRSSATSRWA